MKCKLCGNEKGNLIHKVPERIINVGAFFDYLECGKCGSWMLAEDVDVSDWYPQNYNVYEKKISANLRLYFLIYYICRCPYSKLASVYRFKNLDVQFMRLCGTRIRHRSKILDVGCANGSWLDIMASVGFRNVVGVDLFVPDKKVKKDRKWKFIKGDIFDVEDKDFDLITFNHSFEHMEKPFGVLQYAYDLLNDNGLCEIAIPLANGDAHKEFGRFFCQLDAPRHLYILDKKAMIDMCEKVGFVVEHIGYDSAWLIYALSKGYKETSKSHKELIHNVPATEEYVKRACESNKKGTADQAIFYLRKKQKYSTV